MQQRTAPERTFLFVPGDRPERFDKAVASGADAVILDLEDSVAPDAKTDARAAAAGWLASGSAWVRVNDGDTGRADLAACAGAPGLAGVVVPKAESAAALDAVAAGLPDHVGILALVESAVGLLAAVEIARHPRVRRLAFGNLDFSADCGIDPAPPEEHELLPARAQLVAVSRAAGLPGPVDGVTPDLRDDAATRCGAARALRLGFAGKLCVHPRQVALVHDTFAPDPDQVVWARRVLEVAAGGVGVVDGRMVDRPVVLLAERILARA